jgi:hypothetical protein
MKSKKLTSFKTLNVMNHVPDHLNDFHHLGPIVVNNNKSNSNTNANTRDLNNKKFTYKSFKKELEEHDKSIIPYTNISSDLGKYLDEPTPNFYEAIHVFEHQRDLLSENLYYMYKDYQNYEYMFDELKKEKLDNLDKTSKMIKYLMIRLRDEMTFEADDISKEMSKMDKDCKETRNINSKCSDLISDFNTRLDKIEKKMGIVVYERRLNEIQDKTEYNIEN